MRILLTGATGFVGQQILKALSRIKSIEISLIVREQSIEKIESLINNQKIIFTNDLFSENEEWWESVCKNIDVVIHSAWFTKPGEYLTSTKNYDCLIGSLKLAKGAANAGVSKFLGLGTCFEYDLRQNQPIDINTNLNPTTIYAASKVSLFYFLRSFFDKENISFAWCRVFYLYGENEHPDRLFPYIRNMLNQKKEALLTSGKQVRDFLNVIDAAEQIIEIAISSEKNGPFNICSGNAITVKDFALNIASEWDQKDLLKFGARQDNTTDPPYVVGIKGNAIQPLSKDE